MNPHTWISVYHGLIACFGIGIVISSFCIYHYEKKAKLFDDQQQLVAIQLKKNSLRPSLSVNVDIDAKGQRNYVHVQTGNNPEVISDLIVTIPVKGLIKGFKTTNNFHGDKVQAKVDDLFSFNNKPLAQVAVFRYKELRANSLITTILFWEPSSSMAFEMDERIRTEWYWQFRSESQREEGIVIPKQTNE